LREESSSREKKCSTPVQRDEESREKDLASGEGKNRRKEARTGIKSTRRERKKEGVRGTALKEYMQKKRRLGGERTAGGMGSNPEVMTIVRGSKRGGGGPNDVLIIGRVRGT